jgi:amino acid transporter
MFDSSLVVQSAVSSFNNVAVAAPSFFWSALLMLPLFALVYKFGNDFIEGIRWTGLQNPKWRTFNIALCVEGSILAWLILMHGNYEALRDVASILPYAIAGVLFLISASFIQKLKSVKPETPQWYQKLKYKKLVSLLIVFGGVAVIGFSGQPTWWGFMMQAAAVICGALVGRSSSKGVSPILLTTLIIFALICIMLMQPEFFRFGQLGHLTILHMLIIIFTGALAMAILAVRHIKPHGKIHISAYIKLKWMARIVAGLCLVLFILTESVPVFLGFAGVLLIIFAMSVWHAESVPETLSKKLWAVLLCSFGIMASLPLITALGIIYWVNLPGGKIWKQSKFLL